MGNKPEKILNLDDPHDKWNMSREEMMKHIISIPPQMCEASFTKCYNMHVDAYKKNFENSNMSKYYANRYIPSLEIESLHWRGNEIEFCKQAREKHMRMFPEQYSTK